MQSSTLDQFHDRPPLRHLKRLTTKDGLVQHADHEVPDPAHGYSIDDNARGLIACLWHHQLFGDTSILQLAETYFNYLKKVQKNDGTFHNFVSFSDKKLDAEGSEDSIGRAIWALGETIATIPDHDFAKESEQMFDRAIIDHHLDHEHVRTKAYILLGLLAAGKHEVAKKWADKLIVIFNERSGPEWQWFENSLFYANGILPYAMARAARLLGNAELKDIAMRSYDWLDSVSREQGVPAPIGQNGWYRKGGEKVLYDQQPLEAADMVLAATELFSLTNEAKYLDSALEWFSWYEGKNLQHKSLINQSTGGIYDALTPGGVNENQGAESIVTYLMAYLSLARTAQSNGKTD